MRDANNFRKNESRFSYRQEALDVNGREGQRAPGGGSSAPPRRRLSRGVGRVTIGAMDALFFDLDGTLTDPRIGITRSIQYALEKLDRDIPPEDELVWCIGPPLLGSFEKILGDRQLAATASPLPSVNCLGLWFRSPPSLEHTAWDSGDTSYEASDAPGLSLKYFILSGLSRHSSASSGGVPIRVILGHRPA